MSKFVIAEPGGGLFQGECLGLLFCYSGPASDLDASEILFFESREKAQTCIETILEVARSNESRSLSVLEKWRVECVDGIDIELLALQVHAEGGMYQ